MAGEGFWRSAVRRLAAAGGLVRVAERFGTGQGVILRLARVRPPRRDRFQPLHNLEVAPEALDRALTAFRRWKLDVISLDEVASRLASGAPKRFVCLTFDGGYRDFFQNGYPVLRKHRAPFAVFAPTAFPDGIGEAWWLALEAVVAANPRLSLMMKGGERRYACTTPDEKLGVYRALDQWLRSLPPDELTGAMNDLCRRYGVDAAALTRDAMMNWQEFATLASDQRATIGAATVNYVVLKHLGAQAASREIAMSRAVLQTALARPPRHFAYPFGYAESFTAAHRQMVKEAGFDSAVSARAGPVTASSDRLALPRLRWNGSRSGLIAIRAMAAGLPI